MRLRLPLVLLAAVAAFHCIPIGTDPNGGNGGGSGGGDGAGGGSGGGSGGTPGWTLSYPQSEQAGGVISVVFTPSQGNPAVESFPGNDDPWKKSAALTNRTFDLVRDNGDAHAEAHLTLTIGDPTVTIHITSNASSGGSTVGAASGGINNATWCYRPPAGHANVRFTSEFTGSAAPTVSGQNAQAYYQFMHVGTDCANSAVADFGTVSTDNQCQQTTEDVMVDPDGNACLNGSVDEPDYQFGTGGGSASKAGGGSGSLDVTFKITATPL